MKATMIHAPGDIRLETRPDPVISEPTDAIVRTVATCVCGSDLWPYRGDNDIPEPNPIGHEYVGIVEEVGSAVSTVSPGDFVVGGFLYSCNDCPTCHAGMHANCPRGGGYDGCQAELIRVPLADGTLVATPGAPDRDLIPSLLTLSDVMCTGWHAAISAGVGGGDSVVVVGDGAVGLCGVIAAKQLGAERIIAMSRHADRQDLAHRFGATDIIAERGDEGVAAVRALTDGIGSDRALECVGSEDARRQAVDSVRPGGMVGLVGLPHGGLEAERLFWRNKGIRGGVAPVRAYLDELLPLVWNREIDPGAVFTDHYPLDRVSDAYAAMDQRRTVKALLWT